MTSPPSQPGFRLRRTKEAALWSIPFRKAIFQSTRNQGPPGPLVAGGVRSCNRIAPSMLGLCRYNLSSNYWASSNVLTVDC
ncbi:hypothetical protein GLOTRDRAFT_115928 [Gloeophyllum trabeum ATCC 11539]|uniref:Uncharacterized protein n=1 Tax=Gloeophyllum trabeum (strain ATCC 11539 / FP-39264 / Madison 617) TaxID=670483 RepID=S7Q831_GLOTA|nr:uncharacterized protein GLOTRDRAFT_115928 [Gloeophyllum trabeum ATCC 11539]EPQ55603.1 hypothetical protein GLOTRDRAFT_115928 [Gloeophyllum trabeum ATCC 11539]